MTTVEIFFAGMLFLAPDTAPAGFLLAADPHSLDRTEAHTLVLGWEAECKSGCTADEKKAQKRVLNPGEDRMLTVEWRWAGGTPTKPHHPLQLPPPLRLSLDYVMRFSVLSPGSVLDPDCLTSTIRSECRPLLARIAVPNLSQLATCRLVEGLRFDEKGLVQETLELQWLNTKSASSDDDFRAPAAASLVYDTANVDPAAILEVEIKEYNSAGALVGTSLLEFVPLLGNTEMNLIFLNNSEEELVDDDPRQFVGDHFRHFAKFFDPSPVHRPFPIFRGSLIKMDSDLVARCKLPPRFVSAESRPVCPMAGQ